MGHSRDRFDRPTNSSAVDPRAPEPTPEPEAEIGPVHLHHAVERVDDCGEVEVERVGVVRTGREVSRTVTRHALVQNDGRTPTMLARSITRTSGQ